MIATYLSDNEKKYFSKIEDQELNEYLQEVRGKFDNKYLLQEHTVKEKKLFKKEVIHKFYTLYFDTGLEAQVLNFPSEGSSSINTGVSKSQIITYFLGLLNGIEHKNN